MVAALTPQCVGTETRFEGHIYTENKSIPHTHLKRAADTNTLKETGVQKIYRHRIYAHAHTEGESIKGHNYGGKKKCRHK